MDKIYCQTLAVVLTVLGSGLILETAALAIDSPVTEQPTASPTDGEKTHALVEVEKEPLPELMLSGKKVTALGNCTKYGMETTLPCSYEKSVLHPTENPHSENSLSGVLLAAPTNQELLKPTPAYSSQEIKPNQDAESEPDGENSLVSESSPEGTLTEMVTPVSGLTAELPKPDTSVEPVLKNPPDAGSSQDSNPMQQVTSVSQLSDVKPTDWAFQALQSLVERYGCIAGYPDGTYRGNRAITRYEFAAGLNACLDKVREVITAGTTNLATKEDLAAVQRLQEEFAAELATLRGRVDALESRTAELEANQFSTTTKLTGQVVTYVGDAFGKNASEANNTAFGYRTRLSFNTSFTGKDNLLVRLQATNLRRFDSATEFPQSRLSGATDETLFSATSISGDGSFRLSALQYKFPVGDKLLVSLNAFSSDRLLSEPLSPFSSVTTGAISYFGSINPILYPTGQQTGIGVQWKATRWLNVDFSAGRESRTNDPTVGILNGGYSASVRTIFNFNKLTFSLNYIHFYSPEFGVDTFSGSNAAQVQGAGPVVASTYLSGISYRVSRRFGLSGSVGLINARALGNGTKGDANVLDYRFSMAFYDLGKKGNLAGIVFGMQPRLTGTSNGAIAGAIGLPPGSRSDRDVGFHIEAFYTHRLTDNINITPGVFWLTAPNHDARNPDVVVGVLRTTFSF